MIKKHIPLFVFVNILAAFIAVSAYGDIVDRIVAIVGDDVITLSEVNEEGKPLLTRITNQASPSEMSTAIAQAQDKILQDLINQRILQQKAEKAGIKISEGEVSAALKRVLQRNHTTPEQFASQLAAMGMSEQEYRKNLSTRILSSKLVNREVRSKIIIPEKDIIDYYDTHYTEQLGAGGYYILQIGCTIKDTNTSTGQDEPNPKKEARNRAERIRQLALSGHDFKELAKQYSDLPSAADGGDIGVFKKEEMATYMRDAVTKLKPGETSDVIQTPGCFQIFQLLSSQEGEIITKVPYETAQNEIREILYEQEMKKQYDQWIKTMRDQVYVKIL